MTQLIRNPLIRHEPLAGRFDGLADGVLELTLPKKAAVSGRKVEIN